MNSLKVVFVILPAVFILFIAECGSSRHSEQDVETILTSEFLASQGFTINLTNEPYVIDRSDADRENILLETAFYVRGEYGIYYFTSGDWNEELIAWFVTVSEDGIQFAKNWLGYLNGEPLTIIFNITEPDEHHPLPVWGGGGALSETVFMSMPVDLMPTQIVHEAVHLILRRQGLETNFPRTPETSTWHMVQFLEEGLCEVIDFLFFMEAEDAYKLRVTASWDIENYLHYLAIHAFDIFDNFEYELEWGLRYQKLMSYETAASFVYFLLQHKGSDEEFMRVFENIYLMYEVYGKDMNSMIVEWREYLKMFE